MNRALGGMTSTLFADVTNFPTTRYQGSKRKLAGRILRELDELTYATVLDAFGGTGVVSYAFKCAGKAVTYNDLLNFNKQIGLALVENDHVRLGDAEVSRIGMRRNGVAYGDYIERTFKDVYFTDEENRWLDTAAANVRALACPFERSIAWFALFQAALVKRPYNLFHRANLYMRTADVERSFGNKASWDRGFDEHFAVFAAQANAAVFDGGGACRAIACDALDVAPGFDLVYIDPPYVNESGVGVNYRDFYHFLEGMVQYDRWPGMIDLASKHRRLTTVDDPWSVPARLLAMFERVFDRFRESILVVSYRSDGTPTIDQIAAAMRGVKSSVHIVALEDYQYALSTRRQTKEMLLIGS